VRFITRMAVTLLAACAASHPALAWDPNAGADPTVTSSYSGGNLPNYVVPQRYYNNPTVITPPRSAVVPAGTTPSYAAPVAAVAPAPAAVPVYQAPAPSYQPQPVAVAPVYTPAPVAAVEPAPMPIMRSYKTDKPVNQHYIGIEGMYDQYKEKAVGLKSDTLYGGLDAGVTHYFDPSYYGLFEFRGDYGSEDYKSESGKIDGINDWEFEGRALGGYDYHFAGTTAHFKSYSGLGLRYYVDSGKGKDATNGSGVVSGGYDRKITQLYLPLGVTYEFQAGGLTFAPNAEFDELIYGHVASRLGTLQGYSNTVNEQNWGEGYGVRGEFAISQLDPNGKGWEFTPFVRYWNINDSDPTYALSGINGMGQQTVGGFVEPHNSRVQAGAKLKYLF